MMHTTFITLKDESKHEGYIRRFWPHQGYLILATNVNIKIPFDDIVTAVTPDERGGPCDELQRAKDYMKQARKCNWHGDLPEQDWEKQMPKIEEFMAEYIKLCEKYGLFYGATCGHDGESIHPYPQNEPVNTDELIKDYKNTYEEKK